MRSGAGMAYICPEKCTLPLIHPSARQMLRAILIDDEPNALRSLELLLSKFRGEVEVAASTTDAVKGIALINDVRPDVVFLDINMPELNGFELLEQLGHRAFFLVFTTAYAEYALRAIRQQAVDYLLKPVSTNELSEAIARIRKKAEEKSQVPDALRILQSVMEPKLPRLIVPVKDGADYIASSDITMIEADSNYCRIFMSNDEVYHVAKSLKEYELVLCGAGKPFIRVHNSFIINIHHVSRYVKEDGGYVVMKNKRTVPVSRQKRDEFFGIINLKQPEK